MPLISSWAPINLAPGAAQALTRSSHALIAHGGKAYIFGGELKPRIPVDADLHIVDLSSGQHSSLQPPSAASADDTPAPRVGSALAKVGDALYLWGGRGGKDMKPLSGELWKFDIGKKDNLWEKLATKGDQPEERSYHVLTGVAPNTLYLHAGCPPTGRLSTLHALDLTTLTWKSLADAPEPARGGTVLASVPSVGTAGSLIRFGGFAGYELGGPLDIYDIAQNKWESVTPPGESPSARSVHALLGLPNPNAKKQGGLVAIMYGGERDPAPKKLGHDGAGRFLSDVWGLKRTADGNWSWEKATLKEGSEVPQPRGWFAADITESGQLVVQGGLNENNERIGDAWVLTVEEA